MFRAVPLASGRTLSGTGTARTAGVGARPAARLHVLRSHRLTWPWCGVQFPKPDPELQNPEQGGGGLLREPMAVTTPSGLGRAGCSAYQPEQGDPGRKPP